MVRLRRWALTLNDDGIHAAVPPASIAPEGNGPGGEGPSKETEGGIRRYQIRAGIRKGA